MAEKKSAKTTKARQPKRKELTVRQRSEQAPVQKKRVLSRTAKGASRPLKAIGRFIAKIVRPFRFLLWPFKTRIVRFIGRVLAAVLFLKYFRNSWKELKLVTWPNRKQTLQLTFAVFVFAVVFGAIITAVDYGLDKLFRAIILK